MSRTLSANNSLKTDLSNLVVTGVARIEQTINDTIIDPNTSLIRTDLLPSIAIDRTFVVATLTDRDDLILTIPLHQGDIIKVTSNNKLYVYDGSGGWLEITSPTSLQTLTDCSITSPANGQYLRYNGSVWINGSISLALSSLSDVVISAPIVDQILKWDGTDWINSNNISSLSNLTGSISGNGTETQGSTLRYNAIANKYDYSKLYHSDLLSAGTKSHAQLETDITTIEGDITTLDGRLDTAESNIITLDGRLDTAESNITTAQSNIGTLQFVTTALQGVVTTKGDLFTHNGSSLSRISVGSSGQVLTAIPGASTGLGWTTPSTSGSSYFQTSKLTDVTVSNLKHRQVTVNKPSVFSFGSGGVYSSLNLASRTLLSATPTNVVACCRCDYGDNPFYLAFSTNGSCYKSSNNGLTWSSQSTNLSSFNLTGVGYAGVSCMNLLMWDNVSNRFILAFIGSGNYCVAYSAGVDPSVWFGATGTSTDDCYGMAANIDFSIICITTASNKIYKSTNYAVSFTEVASNAANYGITYSPTLDKFAAVGDNGLYLSNVGASTFTQQVTGYGFDVKWLSDFNLFITVSGNYVYTSTDGSSWTQRGQHNLTSNRVANIQYVMNKYIVLADNNTVNKFSYATSPTASSWTLVSAFDQYFILDWHRFVNEQLTTDYLADWSPSSTVTTNDIVVKSSSGYTTAVGLNSKGSLLTRTSTDYVELPVSVNGYLLSCNSGASSGLQWVAAPATYTSPTVYTTKRTVGNTTINVTGDTKLYELTVGNAGKYIVSTYVRIWSNSGTSYARLWATQDSAGTHQRVGTPFAVLDGDGEDFVLWNITSSVTDSTFCNWTGIVTTTTNNAKIAIYGGIYSGSWQCVNRTSDNTNYSGHLQCTGPL